MLKRFSLVIVTLMMSIVVVLAAAKESPGDHVISFDEPIILMISIGIVVFLLIPPLVMSFFGNLVVRIISGGIPMFYRFHFSGAHVQLDFLFPMAF
ncbi:putative integral inner membrane protein [Bacillus subtilis]|nr:putative integral inner membrane protein [Bacillus subtilis]